MSGPYQAIEGWKLVPVECTDHMLNEACGWVCENENPSDFDDEREKGIYRAMLAAAPDVPSSVETAASVRSGCAIMNALEPCPFCGPQKGEDYEPCLIECRDMKHDYVRGYTIFCPSCGIEMNEEGPQVLVDRWNRVPSTDDADQGDAA